MSALFSEINGGESLTARLRHVTDDQKLYKQKREPQAVSFEDLDRKKALAEERRAQKEREKAIQEGRVPETQVAAQPEVHKTPVFNLEGDKRWVVRHQIGTAAEPIKLCPDVKMRHSIQIAQCQHVYIEVTGKINSISLIDCKRVQVSLVSVVASVELTNCANVDLQVKESMPGVNLENSSCVNLYLLDSARARETEVVTASCTAVNINFPHENDCDELVERAVAEQFVTKLVPNGKGSYMLQTKPSENC